MMGSAFATIPTKDIETAKKFYRDKLGLEILDENPGGVYFQTGSGKIFVYPSEFAGTNKATYASWEVDDVKQTVDMLKDKGIEFEHYDSVQGSTSSDGEIHSLGTDQVAWFKDPDGNILAVGTT